MKITNDLIQKRKEELRLKTEKSKIEEKEKISYLIIDLLAEEKYISALEKAVSNGIDIPKEYAIKGADKIMEEYQRQSYETAKDWLYSAYKTYEKYGFLDKAKEAKKLHSGIVKARITEEIAEAWEK